MVIIRFDNVMYIQGKSNFIMIQECKDQHLVYFSLRELEAQLPKERFIRIHKSFIVNLKRIKALESGKVTMDDGVKIEIGPSYKDNLLAFINTMLISKKP